MLANLTSKRVQLRFVNVLWPWAHAPQDDEHEDAG